MSIRMRVRVQVATTHLLVHSLLLPPCALPPSDPCMLESRRIPCHETHLLQLLSLSESFFLPLSNDPICE